VGTSLYSPGERVTSLLRQRPERVFGVAILENFELAWNHVRGGPPGLLFQAGSISKPVTALAALELVARGDLDLDADVNDRLTGWRLPGPHRVSLRQLLGHTSGLGVSFYPGYAQDADVPTLRQSLDGVPPAATKAVLAGAGQPGRFRYSGGGYTIIQLLITEVTGLPFDQAARELVLEPAGMTSSTFGPPRPAERWPAVARPDWRVYPEAAAAGLWSTPADLARLAGAVAAATAGRASAVRPEVAAQLLSAATPVPARGEWMFLPALGLRRPDSCGLGMFGFGNDRFGHLGGAAGFFSILLGSARDGSGAVVMTAADPGPFPFRLLRTIGDELGWTGLRPRGWPRRGRRLAAGTGSVARVTRTMRSRSLHSVDGRE
jgi:CubicO group peptidase (beta-lactamase class C family)